jgi:hypothetical protein
MHHAAIDIRNPRAGLCLASRREPINGRLVRGYSATIRVRMHQLDYAAKPSVDAMFDTEF